jgi:hypothetical protein
MTSTSARRILRGVLASLGVVATGTGAAVAVRGTAAIPGGAPTVASNDSVLRFYAVWWAAQGPLLWQLASDPDLNKDRLKALCLTTFFGGLARIAAARRTGRPHALFQALTAVELIAPPVLLALRRHVDTSTPPSR